MADLNIFQAGSAGINFAAFCAMVNAETDFMVTQREQLYKGLTDSEGNEVGLNYLTALQVRSSADAAKQSGLDQAAATRSEAIGSMVSGFASLGTLGATTLRANQLESQAKKIRGDIEFKKGEQAKPEEITGKTDVKPNETKPLDPQEEIKKLKNEAKSLSGEAANMRQLSYTLGNSLERLSTGVGGCFSAGYKTDAAYQDEKKVFADGIQQQIERTMQGIIASIQAAEQRQQMAIQTQAAIVQATHA
ncbi:MAG: hypothetical protein JSR58_06845 [Verrucomicrobia bacterium]|nr:hypothetical protein [Verrucomicrobiota bacterium]